MMHKHKVRRSASATLSQIFLWFLKLLLLIQYLTLPVNAGIILSYLNINPTLVWGPSGILKIKDIITNGTKFNASISPWWAEGGSSPGRKVRGFMDISQPYVNACLPLIPDQNFDRNSSMFILITTLGEDAKDCDLQTKITNARDHGYNGIMFINTQDDNGPRQMPINSVDIDVLSQIQVPFSIGGNDGKYILENNFTTQYFIELEDKRDTKLQDILELTILVLGILSIIVVILLLYCCLNAIIKKFKIYLFQKRKANRLALLQSTISSLPIRRWTRELDSFAPENKMCRICRENFKDDEEIRILPCTHIYHLICVDQWILEGRAFCIICKFLLLPIDKHFTPSEISESGEYGVNTNNISPTLQTEISPLIDECFIENESSNNPNVMRKPQVFDCDASFESVLHRSLTPAQRREQFQLQKELNQQRQPQDKESQNRITQNHRETDKSLDILKETEDEGQ